MRAWPRVRDPAHSRGRPESAGTSIAAPVRTRPGGPTALRPRRRVRLRRAGAGDRASRAALAETPAARQRGVPPAPGSRQPAPAQAQAPQWGAASPERGPKPRLQQARPQAGAAQPEQRRPTPSPEPVRRSRVPAPRAWAQPAPRAWAQPAPTRPGRALVARGRPAAVGAREPSLPPPAVAAGRADRRTPGGRSTCGCRVARAAPRRRRGRRRHRRRPLPRRQRPSWRRSRPDA
jgi:translation initiation factor IF-2